MDLDRRRGESPIRSIFCCNDCIRPGNQSSNFELGQIYLGDHLTRSWNRPIKSPVCTSPVSGQLPAPLKGSETLLKETSIRRSSRRRKIKSAKEMLSLITVTKEDFQLWSSSFDALLKSEAGIQVFKNFLETEFAEENLKFWLACESLKSTARHSKKLERRIQDIFDTYISTHSASEVNIDYKMRENIVDQLKSNDASIFTAAQHQIYSLMYRDSYPRFLTSNIVIELFQEIQSNHREDTAKETSTMVKQRRDASYFSCCVKRQECDSTRDSQTTHRNDVIEVRTKPCEVNELEEANPVDSKSQSSENVCSSSGEKLSNELPPSSRQSPSMSKKLNGNVKVSSSSKDKLISSRQASTLCDASFSS